MYVYGIFCARGLDGPSDVYSDFRMLCMYIDFLCTRAVDCPCGVDSVVAGCCVYVYRFCVV